MTALGNGFAVGDTTIATVCRTVSTVATATTASSIGTWMSCIARVVIPATQIRASNLSVDKLSYIVVLRDQETVGMFLGLAQWISSPGILGIGGG